MELYPRIVKNAFNKVSEGLSIMIRQKANTDGEEIENQKEKMNRIRQELQKRLTAVFQE